MLQWADNAAKSEDREAAATINTMDSAEYRKHSAEIRGETVARALFSVADGDVSTNYKNGLADNASAWAVRRVFPGADDRDSGDCMPLSADNRAESASFTVTDGKYRPVRAKNRAAAGNFRTAGAYHATAGAEYLPSSASSEPAGRSDASAGGAEGAA